MHNIKSKQSFTNKELLKIFGAIAILMVVGAAYYSYMRHEALHMAEKRAEITLQNAERTLLIRMGKIETTVNAMRPMAEYALDDPDAMYDIARNTVESSNRVMGAGVAFKADYYPEKGHWFEPYVGYHNGSGTLVTEQLGCPEHDYLQMDWFKKGMASEKGAWSNPYYDNAGGMDYMVSYCLPIREPSGEAVGLIVADITLDTLTSIVRGVRLYPHSYCTLAAGDGTILVGPPASVKKKGKSHVFTEDIDGKNMALTLTISDADMYQRLRRSTLFFTLLALTGVLAVFFIAYRSVQNLWKLNEARIKEQHIEDELAIARNIQQSLLPSETAAEGFRNLEVYGLQISARFVGGDLYDYYVRDNRLLFCVGDVSGKGVPAALLMAIAHSQFRTLSAHAESPDGIMRSLNHAICENNPDIMFITMFLGMLDMDTGMVRYCNAGHNPPILIQNGRAEFLDTEPSLLLGVDENATYVSHTLELSPDATLFLYTDGLTEAENGQMELLGERRALETAGAFQSMTAKDQVERMWETVQRFADGAEQSDDLTLLAIRRTPARHTLTLANDINELSRLEPFLHDFFSQNHLDMAILPNVNLALEEALANVIMYAYPEGEVGDATLEMEVENDSILMTIRDRGIPFNPLLQQEADLDIPLEERRIGGLGIHLIKETMDAVEYAYEEEKNILSMKKVIPKG